MDFDFSQTLIDGCRSQYQIRYWRVMTDEFVKAEIGNWEVTDITE